MQKNNRQSDLDERPQTGTFLLSKADKKFNHDFVRHHVRTQFKKEKEASIEREKSPEAGAEVSIYDQSKMKGNNYFNNGARAMRTTNQELFLNTRDQTGPISKNVKDIREHNKND